VVASRKFKRPAMDTRDPDRIVNQNAMTFITRSINCHGATCFIKPPPAHKAWVIGTHARRNHTQHEN
jgi:hypothetical protein